MSEVFPSLHIRVIRTFYWLERDILVFCLKYSIKSLYKIPKLELINYITAALHIRYISTNYILHILLIIKRFIKLYYKITNYKKI